MSQPSINRSSPEVRVAVIGAGVAGLSCARKLSDHPEFQVDVFEKSRGVGGRAATRRHDATLQFDHGAQYFTARDPRFRDEVEAWLAIGVAQEWRGPIVSIHSGDVTAAKSETVRYVGIPGMSAIGRHLAGNLEIHRESRIKHLTRESGAWRLMDGNGHTHGPYDLVISTAPPPQSLELFGEHSPTIARRIRVVEMLPCWALLIHFAEVLAVTWNGAFVQKSPLAWIARNSSKPGRATDYEAWVLHATPEWSFKHLELTADEVVPPLYDALQQALGSLITLPKVSFMSVHRWRYALPDEPLYEPFVYDAQLNLAVAGDWCGGPKVEGAFLSGLELANHCQATFEN